MRRVRDVILMGIALGIALASPSPKLPDYQGHANPSMEIVSDSISDLETLKRDLIAWAFQMNGVTNVKHVPKADLIIDRIGKALNDPDLKSNLGNRDAVPNGQQGAPMPDSVEGKSPEAAVADLITKYDNLRNELKSYGLVLAKVDLRDDDRWKAEALLMELHDHNLASLPKIEEAAPGQLKNKVLAPARPREGRDDFYEKIKGVSPKRSDKPLSGANWDEFETPPMPGGENTTDAFYLLDPWTVPLGGRTRGPWPPQGLPLGLAKKNEPKTSEMSTVEGRRLRIMVKALLTCQFSAIGWKKNNGMLLWDEARMLEQMERYMAAQKNFKFEPDPMAGLNEDEKFGVQLALCALYRLRSPENPANQVSGGITHSVAAGAKLLLPVESQSEGMREVENFFQKMYTSRGKPVPKEFYPNEVLHLTDLIWDKKFVTENMKLHLFLAVERKWPGPERAPDKPLLPPVVQQPQQVQRNQIFQAPQPPVNVQRAGSLFTGQSDLKPGKLGAGLMTNKEREALVAKMAKDHKPYDGPPSSVFAPEKLNNMGQKGVVEKKIAATTKEMDEAYGEVQLNVGGWDIRFFNSKEPGGLSIDKWFVRGNPGEVDGPFGPKIFFWSLEKMIKDQEDALTQLKKGGGAGQGQAAALEAGITSLVTLSNVGYELFPEYKNLADPLESFNFSDETWKGKIGKARDLLMQAQMRVDTALNDEVAHPFGGKPVTDMIANTQARLKEAQGNLANTILQVLEHGVAINPAANFQFFTEKEWKDFNKEATKYSDAAKNKDSGKMNAPREDLLKQARIVFRGLYPPKDEYSPRGFITRFTVHGNLLRWASAELSFAWTRPEILANYE